MFIDIVNAKITYSTFNESVISQFYASWILRVAWFNCTSNAEICAKISIHPAERNSEFIEVISAPKLRFKIVQSYWISLAICMVLLYNYFLLYYVLVNYIKFENIKISFDIVLTAKIFLILMSQGKSLMHNTLHVTFQPLCLISEHTRKKRLKLFD